MERSYREAREYRRAEYQRALRARNQRAFWLAVRIAIAVLLFLAMFLVGRG